MTEPTPARIFWHSSLCGEPDEEIIDRTLGYELGDWGPCCCDVDGCIASVVAEPKDQT